MDLIHSKPKNKKWSDFLTVKELIEVLNTLPKDYVVLTSEESVAHNLTWDNVWIDKEERSIFLG